MFAQRSPLAFAALALLFAGACRKPEVTSYRIPKEHEPEVSAAKTSDQTASAPAAAPAGGAMANTAVPTAQGAGLTWTAPAHWQAKAASAMRKGSYAITGDGGAVADLSITAFPGDVGGEAANINRWRGQVSLPAASASELAGPMVTRLSTNGLAITVVDFVGPGANAQHLLGAIVPHEGATWFFKLMGPDALVAREKPAFLEFVKSVKSAAP